MYDLYEVNLSKKGRSTSNHLDTIHFLNEMHIANIHSFFLFASELCEERFEILRIICDIELKVYTISVICLLRRYGVEPVSI